MEKFMKGEVVVIPFPFSDLSNSKNRPALVVAKPIGEDVLLAQITSKINLNEFSVEITKDDFKKGKLPITSFVKTNKLFSADIKIIKYKAGEITKNKAKEIEEKLIELIKK